MIRITTRVAVVVDAIAADYHFSCSHRFGSSNGRVDVVLDVNTTPDGHGDCLHRVTVPGTSSTNSKMQTTTSGDANDDDDESSIIDMFVEANSKMSFSQFRDRLRASTKEQSKWSITSRRGECCRENFHVQRSGNGRTVTNDGSRQ
jgi:hypothetical protein